MLDLLIVEDEPNTRHTLVHNYDWNSIGYRVCAAVQSGVEAFSYLQSHHVDVLLTDIVMEHMNGLELIEKIRQLKLPIECVIISGYDDFAFAQVAIKYQVSSYLLKPVEQNDVYALFTSLKEQIASKQDQQSSSEQMKRLLEDSNLDFAEKALENYLKRISWREESILPLLKYFHCVNPGDSFVLALYEMPSMNYAVGKDIIATWYQDTFSRACITFPCGNYHLLFMAFPADFAFSEVASQFCRQNNLRMILSTQTVSIYNLPDLFDKLCAKKDRLFHLPKATLESEDIQVVHSDPMPNTNEYATLLANCIRKKSQQDTHLCLNKFFQQMNRALPSSDLAVITLTELFCLLSDLLAEDGRKGLLSFNDVFKQFRNLTSLGALQQQSTVILATLSEQYTHINRSDVSERIKAYIEAHFGENLSMTELAQKFYFSPNHLGVRFQQETGMTISKYIRKVRLRNACKQLAETNKYIREIATDCGFSSYQSFCTAFQEEYNTTPRHYRYSKAILNTNGKAR